jgi:hypothetical protein
MLFPVRNSNSVFAVLPPFTETYRFAFTVFLSRERIKGIASSLIPKSPYTDKSEKASFIITIIFGLSEISVGSASSSQGCAISSAASTEYPSGFSTSR